MKKRKVCIVGRIAPGIELYDGQTIKTRLLVDELQKKTDWKIFVIDTYYKKHKIRLFIKSIFALLKCRDVFICLSANGIKIYYKLLKFFIKFRRTRVYHYVVGGDHHKFLIEHPHFIKTCSRFAVNWVQTNNLVMELNKLGINNAQYMPNFRLHELADLSSLMKIQKPPFRFVIFSRLNKAKGVSEAAEVIHKINKIHNKNLCILDIYGVVEPDYEEEFKKILENNTEIKYLGAKNSSESTDILKNYFALLFPTHWHGEGFAGTILDAFFAGLPVIATDWNCNAEIVENGKTGFVYPNKLFDTLYDCVEFAIKNPDIINNMRANCLASAKNFLPSKYVNEIINFVETH